MCQYCALRVKADHFSVSVFWIVFSDYWVNFRFYKQDFLLKVHNNHRSTKNLRTYNPNDPMGTRVSFLILLYLFETKEIVLYILVASMIVLGLLRKDKRKERNPYIIGDSSKVEYLTEEELKERLGHGKH